MNKVADIATYDAYGQLTLLVEIKSKIGTTSEWASRLRRNILSHGYFPNVKFFLVALPDRFYLWKDAGNTPEIVNPNYEIDPKPFLRPYFEQSGIAPEKISKPGFDIIIFSWLAELSRSAAEEGSGKQVSKNWLVESGLLDAIRKGRVRTEMVV
ncbi:MAG: hypothetical protein ACE5I1_26655 [bacterium]